MKQNQTKIRAGHFLLTAGSHAHAVRSMPYCCTGLAMTAFDYQQRHLGATT